MSEDWRFNTYHMLTLLLVIAFLLPCSNKFQERFLYLILFKKYISKFWASLLNQTLKIEHGVHKKVYMASKFMKIMYPFIIVGNFWRLNYLVATVLNRIWITFHWVSKILILSPWIFNFIIYQFMFGIRVYYSLATIFSLSTLFSVE